MMWCTSSFGFGRGAPPHSWQTLSRSQISRLAAFHPTPLHLYFGPPFQAGFFSPAMPVCQGHWQFTPCGVFLIGLLPDLHLPHQACCLPQDLTLCLRLRFLPLTPSLILRL